MGPLDRGTDLPGGTAASACVTSARANPHRAEGYENRAQKAEKGPRYWRCSQGAENARIFHRRRGASHIRQSRTGFFRSPCSRARSASRSKADFLLISPLSPARSFSRGTDKYPSYAKCLDGASRRGSNDINAAEGSRNAKVEIELMLRANQVDQPCCARVHTRQREHASCRQREECTR